MAVGATDRLDQRASFSNYGADLEVVAPGVDVYTTGLSNTYQANSGTSFSAPCVAGVAALILSRNNALTNEQVRQTIKDTADDLGAAGFDVQTGYGRINARRALDATPGGDCIDADTAATTRRWAVGRWSTATTAAGRSTRAPWRSAATASTRTATASTRPKARAAANADPLMM